MMEYEYFGETNMEVSRICFGTWAYGGDWGSFDRDDALAAIRRARAMGINFFDTAQAYGFGTAEEVLGEALRDEIVDRRGELVIATKGGLRMEDGELQRDAGRDWLRQGIEESLEHLGTDYVDLYQVHWPDAGTPPEETVSALREFVDEGLTRYVGVSNYGVREMEAFRAHGTLDALQPPYHMFRRDIEDEILPYCREHGIGVLVYGPLAHGLLTGKYTPDTEFPDDDWRSGSEVFQGRAFRRNLEVVNRLEGLAERKGCSIAQLAVTWTLSHPAVDCAIVGARNPEQIEETARSVEVELEPDDLSEIESILEDAVPVGGPTPEGV